MSDSGFEIQTMWFTKQVFDVSNLCKLRRHHGRVVWVSASYPGDPGSIPDTSQGESQAKQERRQLASGLSLIQSSATTRRSSKSAPKKNRENSARDAQEEAKG